MVAIKLIQKDAKWDREAEWETAIDLTTYDVEIEIYKLEIEGMKFQFTVESTLRYESSYCENEAARAPNAYGPVMEIDSEEKLVHAQVTVDWVRPDSVIRSKIVKDISTPDWTRFLNQLRKLAVGVDTNVVIGSEVYGIISGQRWEYNLAVLFQKYDCSDKYWTPEGIADESDYFKKIDIAYRAAGLRKWKSVYNLI